MAITPPALRERRRPEEWEIVGKKSPEETDAQQINRQVNTCRLGEIAYKESIRQTVKRTRHAD